MQKKWIKWLLLAFGLGAVIGLIRLDLLDLTLLAKKDKVVIPAGQRLTIPISADYPGTLRGTWHSKAISAFAAHDKLVKFSITGPNNKILLSQESDTIGSFSIQIKETGTYFLHFNNASLIRATAREVEYEYVYDW